MAAIQGGYARARATRDIGAVVMVHQQGQGYTVEFMTLGGETVAVVTLAAEQVRPIRANEIAHVREVSAA
jgi:hypothetical protein